MKLQEWLKSGKYLPEFMRDFHDQKDLFKSIDVTYERDSDQPSWINAHIYVVDRFLWYMASRGYTLQKSRIKVEFKPFVEWRETDAYKAMTDQFHTTISN